MSDLTAFRDHCRRMATTADAKAKAVEIQTDDDLIAAIRDADEASLWTLLADEIDLWIGRGSADTPDDHTEPLWETP